MAGELSKLSKTADPPVLASQFSTVGVSLYLTSLSLGLQILLNCLYCRGIPDTIMNKQFYMQDNISDKNTFNKIIR